MRHLNTEEMSSISGGQEDVTIMVNIEHFEYHEFMGDVYHVYGAALPAPV